MAIDPIIGKIVQTGFSLGGKPALAFLRTQYMRRGAEFADVVSLGGAQPELNEAIAILRGTSDTLPAAMLLKLKGVLSSRPPIFGDAEARTFLAEPRVAELIKSGALRTLRNEDILEERTEARAIHAELFNDDGMYGERLIEDAIAFATLTLLAHLTPGDRQTLELLGLLRDEIHGRFDEVLEEIEGLKGVGAFTTLEAEPFDHEVRSGTRRIRRQRLLQIDDYPERALAFGQRVETGLHLANDLTRADAFREIATVLVRAERVAEGEEWIQKAEALGADCTCERARVAIAGKDWATALKHSS